MQKFNLIYKTLLFVLGTTVTASSIAGTATIPNTFVSGEAAVAADVNDNFSAIKSAVDDNDSRISALETATGFVSVSAHAFRDENAGNDCRWNSNATSRYGYYEAGGAIDCDAVAAIQLPHNSTVTSLTCYLYDNDPLAGIQMHGRLHRTDFMSTLNSIFITPTTVDSGSVQVLTDTTVEAASSGAEVIDNQNYTYHLTIFFGDTDSADNDARVYGCTVGYQ